MGRTLYDKIWDDHLVANNPDGTSLIYIDRHLIHEVTSPQAFEGLEVAHRQPWRTESIVASILEGFGYETRPAGHGMARRPRCTGHPGRA